jgi:hypothetical protein
MTARRLIEGASLAADARNDAQRLRNKAEQVRAIADQTTDPVRRRALLDIAVCYVVLAQSAGEQDTSRRKA